MRSNELPDSVFYWRKENADELYYFESSLADGPKPAAIYIERVGDEYELSSEAVRIIAVE